jgi:hypothetical protein
LSRLFFNESYAGTTVGEMKDGKSIRSRIYADHAKLFHQLGVLSIGKKVARFPPPLYVVAAPFAAGVAEQTRDLCSAVSGQRSLEKLPAGLRQ